MLRKFPRTGYHTFNKSEHTKRCQAELHCRHNCTPLPEVQRMIIPASTQGERSSSPLAGAPPPKAKPPAAGAAAGTPAEFHKMVHEGIDRQPEIERFMWFSVYMNIFQANASEPARACGTGVHRMVMLQRSDIDMITNACISVCGTPHTWYADTHAIRSKGGARAGRQAGRPAPNPPDAPPKLKLICLAQCSCVFMLMRQGDSTSDRGRERKNAREGSFVWRRAAVL